MKIRQICILIAGFAAGLAASLPAAALDATATAERFRALGIKLEWADATPERVATGRSADINLTQKNVTAADIAALAAMPRLAQISMHEAVTHDQIIALAPAPALTDLFFGGRPNLTDESIAAIAAMPRLRNLRLGASTGFSPNGLAPLARATNLERLALNSTRVSIADYSFLASLQKLTHLDLFDLGSMTDEALVHIGAIGGLRALNLNGTNVSDKGIAHLAGLKSLTALSLVRTRVTPAALQVIGQLNSLATISIGGLSLSDAALPMLPALQSFYVYDSATADALAESLSRQPNLSTIHLRKTRITDVGLRHLAATPKLRQLHLVDGILTDAGFSGLAFPEATGINLSGNRELSDAVLPALVIQPKLTSLDLRQTRVTKEGIAAALNQRPAGLPTLRISN